MNWNPCVPNIAICYALHDNRVSPAQKKHICGVSNLLWTKSAIQSAVLGWLALLAVHGCSAWTGIGLGFGWLTCGVAGLFGVPGVTMLLILNLIL